MSESFNLTEEVVYLEEAVMWMSSLAEFMIVFVVFLALVRIAADALNENLKPHCGANRPKVFKPNRE